jgi:hypothetical protein
LLVPILLSGCASLPEGVQMTDEERKVCAAEGCGVFTLNELRAFGAEMMRRGFLEGQKRRGQSL